ncbi:MAG: 1-acyl-sn-glycerol-3-phosphate acyltransferase [Oleiphilaceae bacterium]|nr:1-acyl-sn-glycerol-3-phosphate acyltransferase [Oleiphilaceae bacterium]
MTVLMETLRLSFRLTFFFVFLLVSVATLLVLRVVDLGRGEPIDRAPFANLYFKGFCRLLGFTLHCHGNPLTGAGLMVSNHVSWTDIPVLGSCTALCFLAKAEVSDWPVIGWIARDIGTLFIKRSAGKSAEVRRQIAQGLTQNSQVLIFPEGTTTNGTGVAPFRSPLLAAAINTGRPVQAITIAYCRNGQPDLVVPFVGDDRFENHLVRLLRKPAVDVDILFHPPLATTDATAKQLAEQLHRQVSDGLASFASTGIEPNTSPTVT